MVPPPGTLKLMANDPPTRSAAVIALRSDPTPVSLVVVTVRTVWAGADPTSPRASRPAGSRRRDSTGHRNRRRAGDRVSGRTGRSLRATRTRRRGAAYQ